MSGQGLKTGLLWPVEEDGRKLGMPWAGGLNQPMVSQYDLNCDARGDLVIFDRQDESILPFVLEANGWRFAPEYRSLFPADSVQDWMLLKDFNCDGRPDLFTGTRQNVRVFRNTGDPSKMFALYAEPLTTLSRIDDPPTTLNVYAAISDLVALEDIDGDGDLDLLSNDVTGAYVTAMRNFAQERFGRCDTLALELTSLCWGHFIEVYDRENRIFDVQLELDPCNFEYKTAHTGGTLTALHLNGDTLIDLLFGDTESTYLIALTNGGTRRIAHMTSRETRYPLASQSVQLKYLPAAYWVDADGDSLGDLLAAPFEWGTGQDVRSLWRYRNRGQDRRPDFHLMETGFLQGDMIDGGSESTPAFGDLDGDGLPDFILGVGAMFDESGPQPGYLKAYRNAGSKEKPSFESWKLEFALPDSLLDERFFDRVAPACADLDGDGRVDLLTGNAAGQVVWWRNAGGGRFDLADADLLKLPRNSERFAAPAPFDLDGDGDFDLVVGMGRGKLYHFINAGSRLRPSFVLVNNDYGKIDVSDDRLGPLSYPQPIFFRPSSDSRPLLGVGDQAGNWNVYDICSESNRAFVRRAVFNPAEAGLRARVAVWPQSADDTLRLVWGTWRGGAMRFDLPLNQIPDASSESCDWSQFDERALRCLPNPNPSSGRVVVDTEAGTLVEVFNPLGQRVYSRTHGEELPAFNVSGWGPGIYFCRCSRSGRSAYAKLVANP